MSQSSSLRAEAIEIVQRLGLLDILTRFGEARLVGSVALDLVVKPDIDLHLLLDQEPLLYATTEIAGSLISMEEVKEVRISDYRGKESLKLGLDCIPGRSSSWSIDIWITSDPSTTGFELTDKMEKALRPEQREVILDIKRSYYEKGQLRDGLSSMIYAAVLEEGVSGLEEFQDYLKRDSGEDEQITR
jgi:hypothetical protein